MYQQLLKNKNKLIVFFALIGLIAFEATTTGDFHIFLEASQDLFNGENIYTNLYHEWYHYFYDLFFAIIIYPLSFLPLYVANLIWLLLNVFFTYRIYKILEHYLSLDQLPAKQKTGVLIIASLFIFTLWHKNIHLTQMTIFILFLCLEGIYKIENKRVIFGSILIALGISVKILPLVLLPYLLYRSQFKATLCIILFTIILNLFPILFFGFDHTWFLLQERWTLINPSNNEHVLDVTERSFHSLTTLLTTLFVGDAANVHSLHLKRNITDVSYETLSIIINTTRGVLILGTLFFLKTKPFVSFQSKRQTLYELSYILLLTPLLFPHQQHYAFYFAFPAIMYLVYFFFHFFQVSGSRKSKLFFVVLFLLIFVLLNSHFLLGVYQNYYDHFKTLTYGVLALIPLLLYAKPKKITSKH